MSDAKKNLIDSINKMSLEELWTIRSTTINTRRVIAGIGIFIILFALIVGNIISYMLCGVLVYILAHVSTGFDTALSLIEERLVKLDK